MDSDFITLCLIIGTIFGLAPTFVAMKRNHKYKGSIFLINLIPIFGGVYAMIWACNRDTKEEEKKRK